MEHSEDEYNRRLDRLVAKANYFEKEVLDSTIRHLEARTSFFDKLAVLAAGSLAVAISFLTTAIQNNPLRQLIQQHLGALTVALGCILLSLTCCVLHNYTASVLLRLVKKQLEILSDGAHHMKNMFEMYGMNSAGPPEPHRERFDSFIAQSEKTKVERRWCLKIAGVLGAITVLAFIIGYTVGLGEVHIIVGAMKGIKC
ncbi:MAG TPA: hypothetical protein VN670_10535 [Acidobacteriaceae bacterium]|nr:hypothetical protein [Acidobacteriaceae bacterium]